MIQKLTKITEDVLEYFFNAPDTEIHVRGLADETNIPYSSVRNALLDLEEKNLVKKREEPKMTFYSARTDSETFRLKKRLYNLRRLYDTELINTLEEQYHPDALVLFGSYLQGTDRSDSDIDIAVINGRESELNLSNYEEKLHREIQLVQVEDPRTEETDFRNTLANGYVLQGYLAVA